jgi:hypothetical protein
MSKNLCLQYDFNDKVNPYWELRAELTWAVDIGEWWPVFNSMVAFARELYVDIRSPSLVGEPD